MPASASWLWGGNDPQGLQPDPGAAFRPAGTASPAAPPPLRGDSRSSARSSSAPKREPCRRAAGEAVADGAVDSAPLPPPLPKPSPALSLSGCSSMPQLQLRPTGIVIPGRVTQPVRSTSKSGQTLGRENEEGVEASLAEVPPLWSTLAGEQLGALSRELANLRQEVLCLKKGALACQNVGLPSSESEFASRPSGESSSLQIAGSPDQLAQLTRELVSLRKDMDSVQLACSKCDAGVKQSEEFASSGQMQTGPQPNPINEKLAAVLAEFDQNMKSWLQQRLDEQAKDQERQEGDQRKAWEAALELRAKSLEVSMRKIEEKFIGEVQQLASERKTAESVMQNVFVEQCSGVEKCLAKSTTEIREEMQRALDEIEVRLHQQSPDVPNDRVLLDTKAMWSSDLQIVVEAMAQLEREQDDKHAVLRSSLQELDTCLRDEIRHSLESHHEVQADVIQQTMNQLLRNLNDAFATYKTQNQTQIDHAVDELAKAKLGFQQMLERQAPELSGLEKENSGPRVASPAASAMMPTGKARSLPAAEQHMPTGKAPAEPGRSSPMRMRSPMRSRPLAAVSTASQADGLVQSWGARRRRM